MGFGKFWTEEGHLQGRIRRGTFNYLQAAGIQAGLQVICTERLSNLFGRHFTIVDFFVDYAFIDGA